MTKACIFDLYGTLTNSLHSIAYFVNTEIAQYGMPPVPADDFKTLSGNGARTLIKRVLARYDKTDAQLEEKILRGYNAAYDADALYLCTAYAGTHSLLKELKERSVSVNVLSNKPQSTTEKVVKTLFGEHTFSCIFGARDAVPLKPDPAGVYEILKTIGVKKEECLYIGDTATDIQTGKNAGLFTVGVLWGFRTRAELQAAGAAKIVKYPTEILDLL